MPTGMIRPTRVPSKLIPFAEQSGKQPPSYWDVYKAAINGRIPTVEIDGKILIRESDLPRVAAHFGLIVNSQAAA